MKTILTLLLICATFVTAQAAIPTITVYYHRNCLLCSATIIKEKVSTLLADGTPFDYYARYVDCVWGFSTCPKRTDIPIDLNQSNEWVSAVSADEFNYAIRQIENGTLKGQHHQIVLPSNLGKKFMVTVNWEVKQQEDAPDETIIVTIQNVE